MPVSLCLTIHLSRSANFFIMFSLFILLFHSLVMLYGYLYCGHGFDHKGTWIALLPGRTKKETEEGFMADMVG